MYAVYHITNSRISLMAPSSKFSIFIFLIFMFHTSVCMSQVNNQEGYEKCKSNFVCGNRVNASFPFWGDHHNVDADSRPEFCGLPGYKLDCLDGDVAEIEISDETYRVLEISPDRQVMNIINKDFTDDDDVCPYRVLEIADFNSPFFDVYADYFTLPRLCSPLSCSIFNIYFDCPSFNSSDVFLYRFNCQINHTGESSTSDAYFTFYTANRNNPNFSTRDFSYCNMSAKVPVMREALGGLTNNSETLSVVIKQGFTVTYVTAASATSSSVCTTCSDTGGTCGYDIATNFTTCFRGMLFS
ncbi:hypothetical protein MKX03_008132 [Papaver bracteatum]|nr:hypothetical protein MKX03_008132 [Papaver bracteatum]